jgi:hypothetical protein
MKQRCYLNIVLLIFIIGLIVNLVISQIGQCPKHPCEDIIYCTSKEIADSSYNCGLPCSMNLIFEGLWDWCCNALSVVESIPPEEIKLLTIGGCCQYIAGTYTCLDTDRYLVVITDGKFKLGRICNFDIGLCIFSSYA